MRDTMGASAPPTTSVRTIVSSAIELAVMSAERGRIVGMTAASAGPKSWPTAENTKVMSSRCAKSPRSCGTRAASGIKATAAARPRLHHSMICLRSRRSAITPAGGANSTAGTVYVSNVTATGVLPPEMSYARMISEKSRNLSASCAASCANQMFLNVVFRSTARKPPGLSTSNLNGSALKGSAIAVVDTSPERQARGVFLPARGEDGHALAWPGGGRESVIHDLPLAEVEGLGATFRVDAGVAKLRSGCLAADAGDAAQRPAQLLAAELKDGFDEPEEGIQVRYVHRRLFADVQHDQR